MPDELKEISDTLRTVEMKFKTQIDKMTKIEASNFNYIKSINLMSDGNIFKKCTLNNRKSIIEILEVMEAFRLKLDSELNLNMNDDQIASELKNFNEEKSDFHDIKTNQNGNTIISDKKFHLMTKPYPKGPVKKQTQPPAPDGEIQRI